MNENIVSSQSVSDNPHTKSEIASFTNPMKTYLSRKSLLPASLALAAFFGLSQLAGAATIWSNPNGGDWSVGANWNSPFTAPGATNDVQFGDAGAGQTTTDDIASETIDSLIYNQDDSLQQTTVIPPGQTLTIASSVAAGSPILYVGSTAAITTSTTAVIAAIQGTDLTSSLDLTGSGDIWVAQGNTTAGTHNAQLNMQGLGMLNASIGRLLVGVNVNGINRASGFLLLAQTNVITATGASPQVEVGEATANGNSGQPTMTFSFGQNNQLYADTMRLGGDKCEVSMDFASAQNSAPSLIIRNSDQVSPCTVIDFGYAAGDGGTGTTETMAADFSAGTIDLLANTVHIPQGQPGSGTGAATGTVTLGAGKFTVADLEIGYGNASAANSGGCTGTLNVNNNGLFSTGAVVTCSTVLNLARTNTASTSIAPVTATLNIGSDNTAGTVIANTITSGGGNSTINLNAGTLVVSNTIGSLALPIRNFSMGASGSATLDIPLSNSGGAVTVSNLTTGAGNLINITAVPGIATYPATFTVIQYQGAENGSGAGTFTLNSLPAASPSYAGTILDTGNGMVQVKLTAGPTAILATTWTGAANNDWDYTSQNWLYQGVPALFVDGRATIFNDSTTETNIALSASPLSPGSVTVNNSVVQYTFGGTGYLNSGTLTKSGSASLTLDNSGGNNGISTVVINGGTLQLGVGDAGNGGLNAVIITNNGALVVDRTDNVTLNSAISGTGTVSEIGGGNLILSGANSYSGATLVTNGTLELDETSSGTGPVTATAGTVLSGLGVINGPVTVAGELSPGSSTLPGNFQAEDGLTLSAGSTLNFGLSASDTSTSDGANDSVVVTGNLHVSGNSINVNFAGIPQSSTYTLLTYSGTLSGTFNPVVTGTHFPVTLDAVSTPGSVLLDVTGSSGYALDWSSTSSSAWDNVTSNWLNLANSTPSTFLSGDSVQFDDTLNVQTTVTIGAGVTVYPSVITNVSDNNNFTINGAGGIGGSASIVKAGKSTLAIATANTFTGTIDVQGGTLQTQNGAALGAAASTTIENGATLDMDGQNLGSATITVSGPGVGGQGAIINSGANDVQAFRNVVLLGDTTIGGAVNWEMNNSGGTASLSTGGYPYNLTKVGANVIDLQNLTTFDTELANIDIQAGTLLFNGITPDMGNPTNTLTVESGAELAFGGDQVTYDKQIVIDGNGVTTSINNEGGANVDLSGLVTLNGNCLFNVGGVELQLSGGVNGSGGLTLSGGSPLILSGANTFTGSTVVNGGTLQLLAGATLSSSTNITLAAGTTLDMQATPLALVSGQSLNGNGTVINSSLAAGAGSVVSPGVNAVGLLTVNGAIALSGDTAMNLDPANATNSVLSSTAGITYGGTLTLTELSSPASGSSFKLFHASSYSGSFANIVPATPGPGLAWVTSALTTSGTLEVANAALPRIGSVVHQGSSLVISGTNGTANATYYVLGSTNVTLPVAEWTRIATNTFTGTGSFNYTNSLSPSVPQYFYQILVPAP
jgi:fibronectin-binding autotransporter adhesin